MDKKIYRSTSDYVLTGVCGGLAEYFEVETTMVRLIFILLLLGGGSGLLIYIILSLIIPRKKAVNLDKKEVTSEIKIEKNEKRNGKNLIGIILISVGLISILNQIFPIHIRPEIVWPSILILIGTYFIFK